MAPPTLTISADELRNVSIFADLDDEARTFLSDACRVRRYPRGTFLFFQDEPAEKLYFVVTGTVRVFQALADGREFTFEHLGPWEVLAAVCFFDGGPYPASAETLAPSSIAEIDARAMARLIETRPDVAVACMQMLSGRLRRAHQRSTDLAIRTVHERLAAVLLQLHQDQLASAEPEEGATPVALSGSVAAPLAGRASDLALLIGAARETVVRALHDFARQGAVQVDHGQVTMLDPARLEVWTHPQT